MTKVKTTIKTTRMEMTSALEKYLEKRVAYLSKFLKGRKLEDEVFFDIELARRTSKQKKDDDLYTAEFNISIGKTRLRAISNKSDIFKAIDDAKKEMEKELVNMKEKKIVKARSGARKIKKMLRE